MSREVISQVLSPDNAPYVNGVQAGLKFAPATIKAVYQGLVEKGGFGINDKLVSDADASENAQVIVTRIKPIKMDPREQGASKNGASFSANNHYTQTESVGIDVLTVVDDVIVLPRARQETIQLDLLAGQAEQFANRIRTIANGMTTASKLFRVYDDKVKGKEVYETKVTESDIANNKVSVKFVEANSKLDEGDEEHGIDIFPEDGRIAVFKTSYRATLKTSGVLVISSNLAYEALKMSGINDNATKMEDGYVGTIDGVPCHIISNESLAHASAFLGLPSDELKKSPFVGYISSALANARGMATTGLTKVVDATSGQGLLLQPYFKLGAVSWFAKGNSILVSEDYDLYGEIQGLVGTTGITYRVKAGGSRLTPSIPASTSNSWNLENDGFTLSNVTALDDWNVDHVAKAYFYVGDAVATSVHDFCVKAKATAQAKKGTFSIATKKSVTLSNGDIVNVLVIADDGTVSLGAKAK